MLNPNCSESVGRIDVTHGEREFLRLKAKELFEGEHDLNPDYIDEDETESFFDQIFKTDGTEGGAWMSEGTSNDIDKLKVLLDVYRGKIKVFNLEDD